MKTNRPNIHLKHIFKALDLVGRKIGEGKRIILKKHTKNPFRHLFFIMTNRMNSSNSKCLISKNRFRDLNALLFAENIQFLSLTVNQDQTFKNIKKKKKTSAFSYILCEFWLKQLVKNCFDARHKALENVPKKSIIKASRISEWVQMILLFRHRSYSTYRVRFTLNRTRERPGQFYTMLKMQTLKRIQ